MSKAVMASIQPYYVFLIIAKYMGWDIPQDKKVEVRKGFPKDKDWNKKVDIYCSKSKKSFNRIPKEYQSLMRPFLGKVIGAFVCDKIEEFHEWQLNPQGKFQEAEQVNLDLFLKRSCLSYEEVCTYRKKLPYYKPLYCWPISQLKIYDKPKELSEFRKPCKYAPNSTCYPYNCKLCPYNYLTRPFLNWGYVEKLKE